MPYRKFDRTIYVDMKKDFVVKYKYESERRHQSVFLIKCYERYIENVFEKKRLLKN